MYFPNLHRFYPQRLLSYTQTQANIIFSPFVFSLFHSAGFISHTVVYVFHSVVFIFHSVVQRILQENRKKMPLHQTIFHAVGAIKKAPDCISSPEPSLFYLSTFNDESRVPDSVSPFPYEAGNAEWFLLRRWYALLPAHHAHEPSCLS